MASGARFFAQSVFRRGPRVRRSGTACGKEKRSPISEGDRTPPQRDSRQLRALLLARGMNLRVHGAHPFWSYPAVPEGPGPLPEGRAEG